jgi:YfiH family protein
MIGVCAQILSQSGIVHRFFGRKGGASPRAGLNSSYDVGDTPARVNENRARICAEFGMRVDQLYVPKQVHGDNIVRVDEEHTPGDIAQRQADALWTTRKGILLGIQTADCVPVLLGSNDFSVVAAIHAGWKGAANGIVAKTVLEICAALGIGPEQMVAAIGPCAGFDVYEVGPEVVAAIQNESWKNEIVRKGDGDRSFVDVAGWVALQLKNVGVSKVEIIRHCTIRMPEDYFSHRREKSKSGRQLCVVSLLSKR